MNRREFLKKMGLTAGGVTAVAVGVAKLPKVELSDRKLTREQKYFFEGLNKLINTGHTD